MKTTLKVFLGILAFIFIGNFALDLLFANGYLEVETYSEYVYVESAFLKLFIGILSLWFMIKGDKNV